MSLVGLNLTCRRCTIVYDNGNLRYLSWMNPSASIVALFSLTIVTACETVCHGQTETVNWQLNESGTELLKKIISGDRSAPARRQASRSFSLIPQNQLKSLTLH